MVICVLVLQMFIPTSAGDIWVETTQLDFEDGTIQNTSVTLSPGNVTLAQTQDWWENKWTYRMPINITENSGTTLENFQVVAEAYTASLIAEGKMRPDMGDVRFTDSSGNLIPHWIESNDFVANWRFDEGLGLIASDDTYNDNHGAINGATWISGVYGTALSFDGIDDYVEVPDSSSLDITQGLTIGCWVKIDTLGTGPIILSKFWDDNDEAWYICCQPDGTLQFVIAQDPDNDPTNSYIDSNSLLVENTLYYISVVYDGYNNQLLLYINGVLDNSKTISYGLRGGNQPIRIGAYRNNPGSISGFINGTIDEVRIYDRVLSSDEINATFYGKSRIWVNVPNIPASSTTTIYMYYANPGALDSSDFDATFTKEFGESGLVGQWHMDEGVGDTAVDYSGNGNTGILGGDGLGIDMPEWKEVDGGQWDNRRDVRFSAGSCLEFDGTEDFIEVNSSANLNITDAITIEAWINPDVVMGNDFELVAKGGVYYFELNRNTHDLPKMSFWHFPVSGSPNWYDANTDIPVGEWTHVAITWDQNSGNGTFYFNGQSDGTFFNPVALKTDSNPIGIGNLIVNNNRFFDGLIDEVRIYNRSLSANEIKTHYERRKYSSPEPFITYSSEESGYWQIEGKWQYRRPIIIDNTGNPDNLTDYQVMVEVNTTDLISQGKIQPDGGDIRFVDQSGNQIPYWVEVFDNMSHDEPTDFVGKWRLDEGYGNNTVDDSINGNNGTHYGNTKLLMHLDDLAINSTKDESPYVNHGQLGSISGPDINDPTWNTSGSIAGNHLTFDGLVDYVEIQDKTILDLNFEHTIEVWINVSSIDSYEEDIISKHSYGLSNGWRLSVSNNSKILYTTYPGSTWYSNSTIDLNKWYHIVVTFNGSAKSMYINGVLDNQTSVPATNLNDYNVRIGGMHGNNTFSFHGSIDEVAIYSKALTAEEIETHYNNQYARFIDWTLGKFGNAVDFDGVDDYVDILNSTNLDTNIGSIDIWFKARPNQVSAARIFESYASGTNYYSVMVDGGKLRFVGRKDGSDIWEIFSPNPVNDWEWHHVVGTWDDKKAVLYIDGIEVARSLGNMTLNLSPSPDSDIGHAPQHPYWFNGLVDEVRIYNRALTPEEVRVYYHERTRVWLNVPAINANSNMTIFMYYGNPNASSISNYDRIFTKDYEEDGLAGLWYMDEGFGQTLIDSSGNENHGTLTNGPSWEIEDGGQWDGRSDVRFYSGSTLEFDGVDDYVNCGHNPSLDITGDITIEAWINTYTTTPFVQDIVEKRSDGGQNWDDFSFYIRSNDELSFHTSMMGAATIYETSNLNLKTHTWYHVAATYNSTTLKIYCNGLEVLSENDASGIAVNSYETWIGNNDYIDEYFNGMIDEVRIYNRTLTEGEINAHYERRKFTLQPPMVNLGIEGLGYIAYGVYISSVNDTDMNGTIWNSISWTETLPPGTDITFATRTGNTSNPDGTWSNWSSEYTDYISSVITSPRARYIQYRVTMTTSDINATPVLEAVTIDYTLNSVNSASLSLPADNLWTNNNIPTFSWVFNDPNGDTQGGFVLEIDDDLSFSTVDITSGINSTDVSNWVPLSPVPDGPWHWRIRTMDEYGLWSVWSENWTINLDTVKPTISLVSPGNNTIIIPGTSIDFSITDPNLLQVNYSINGGPEIPLSGPYDIDTSGWTDGDYTIVINTEDLAGNVNSSLFFFTISSVAPTFDSGIEDFMTYTGDTFVIYANFTDNTDVTSVTIHYRNEAGTWTSMTMKKDFDAGPGGVDRFSISSSELGIVTWNDDSDWHFYFEASDGTLTSNHGDSGSYFIVTVLDNMDPNADAGPDQTIDEDTKITVDAGESTDNIGIVSYAWDWDSSDGISAENSTESAMHIYSTPGTYFVTLNVTDDEGNWDTDNLIITVRDTTSPVADAGLDQEVDEDIEISFDGSDSSDNHGITGYYWDFDDSDGIGIDAIGVLVEHVYSIPGIYIVTLNVTDETGNYDLTTVIVTVLDATAPTADAGQDVAIFEGDDVAFNGSKSNDNNGTTGLTYTWTFYEGTTLVTLDGESPTYTFDNHGFYLVTLNVSDTAGNWDIDTIAVLVLSDYDEDGIPDIDDPDDDNDGILDINDDFPFDPAEDTDTDNDGTGDNADSDDDGDGVSDSEDNFPIDPTEWVDTDEDGVGDNEDLDDDDDGTIDTKDDFPLDEAEDTDTDNDGTGDNADDDDDGDGTSDSEDEFPLDATEWADFDGDGSGDNKDLDDDDDGRIDTEDYEPFNREIQDPPEDPFPWWLLIVGLIVGILVGFLLTRMKREKKEEIPEEEDAIGAIVEEEEPEPEDYEEKEEEPMVIEDEEARPVEDEEVEAREEIVEDEDIHEEHLGQDILNVWNEKYESKGYLGTICPSCFEEAEFEVETSKAGKDFTCPNCKAKYVYEEE